MPGWATEWIVLATFFLVVLLVACAVLIMKVKRLYAALEVASELRSMFLDLDRVKEVLRSRAAHLRGVCKAQVEYQQTVFGASGDPEEVIGEVSGKIASAKAKFWRAAKLAEQFYNIPLPKSYREYLTKEENQPVSEPSQPSAS